MAGECHWHLRVRAASQKGREGRINTEIADRLAFLCCCRLTDDGGFRGAILVVDQAGVPLQFKVTDPVTPTSAQKILYGGTLQWHVRRNIIAAPLLNALEQKPHLVVTDDQDALDFRRDTSDWDVPIVFLASHDERLATQLAGGELIEPQGFRAFVLKNAPGFDDDLQIARGILNEVGKRFDAVEVFERVHRAIDAVSEERSKG